MNGWKLVPIEPTEAMAEDGHAAYWHWRNDNADLREKLAVAFKAMLAAAPTSPAQEDEPVAYEVEDPSGNWRLVRKGSEFAKHGYEVRPLYTRPTPQAQKDEPVAWINQTANPYAPLDMHFQFQNPHDAKWTPLYTHPDDKLRKLAEEYIEYMYPGADVDRSTVQIMSFLYYYGKNLRAALEGK